MGIISIPFWLIFWGGNIAVGLPVSPINKSNIFLLFVALHFGALHLLFMFGVKYAMKYRSELYYILILIGNNFVDAIGNFFPQSGISTYKTTINEYIIDGIVLILFIRKGVLNYRIWNNG